MCRGSRTFELRVFDAATQSLRGVGIYADGSVMGYASVKDTFVATFRDVPPMRLMGVMVNYAGPGFDIPAPNGLDIVGTVMRFLPMFPIHAFDFGPCVSTPWGDDMTILSGKKFSGWDSLLTYIANLRSASTVRAYCIGLLPANLSGEIGVNQLGIGRSGVAIAAKDNTRALSHELGHAMLLDHVAAGGAPAPFNNNYPKYREGTLRFGTIGEVGLNTARMTAFDPATDTDLMTYFDANDVPFPASTWISPYHYRWMMDWIRATVGTGDLQVVIAVIASAMVLNFRMHREGRVDLLPSYRVSRVRDHGGHTLAFGLMVDLIGRDAEVLGSHRCRKHNDRQDPDGPFLDFHEVIAWSDDIARLAFVRKGRVVHVVDVETHEPSIQLGQVHRVQRDGDLARVEWTHSGA